MTTLRRQKRYNIFIHIFAPIFLGVMIYGLFRGLYLIDPTKKYFPILDNSHLPNWIIYNLPDGLWFYAFLSTVILIWEQKLAGRFLAWVLLAIIISSLLEIGQAYHLVHGTFDANDLVAYLIATIFCFINFYRQLFAI